MNTAVRCGRDNALPRQNGMKYNENEEFIDVYKRQETALGVLHALNVRDQAQGGAVAHAAHYGIQSDAVSYTHLDVYKRQHRGKPV